MASVLEYLRDFSGLLATGYERIRLVPTQLHTFITSPPFYQGCFIWGINLISLHISPWHEIVCSLLVVGTTMHALTGQCQLVPRDAPYWMPFLVWFPPHDRPISRFLVTFLLDVVAHFAFEGSSDLLGGLVAAAFVMMMCLFRLFATRDVTVAVAEGVVHRCSMAIFFAAWRGRDFVDPLSPLLVALAALIPPPDQALLLPQIAPAADMPI